jgi:Fic family protein
LTTLNPARFDRPDILKRLTAASRSLAELKGVAASMPNHAMLINTLGLQEAKDRSFTLHRNTIRRSLRS